MALKLRVSRYGNQPMGASAEHVFDEKGGTIGRSRENDWVLPDSDRVVSGQHAVINFINGEYRIRDTSTNGTFLNALAMSKGDERPIRNGDHLKIGPYEISAAVDELAGDSMPPQGQQVYGAGDLLQGAGVDPRETLDPLELFDRALKPDGGFDFGGHAAQPDHSGPEHSGFEPPNALPDPDPFRPEPAPGAIPVDWDKTGLGRGQSGESHESSGWPAEPAVPAPAAATQRVAVPAPRPEPLNTDQLDPIAVLLREAGVPPDRVTEETYAMLGQIVQVVVAGMIEVLRARAQIKYEFRVPDTIMKPVENNPLKFSINAQDALHNLFGKRNPGFQSPVDAFQESFNDVKTHQMAVVAGMRAAYKAMLEYFDPNGLESEFDERMKRGVLGGLLNKGKYWDYYEELYKSLVKDGDASFQKLFGEAFGRAYEDQMKRLSAMRSR